jgi:hypothetical protein
MPNAILIRVANVSQISATVVHREATFGYHRVLKVFCAPYQPERTTAAPPSSAATILAQLMGRT